MLIKLGEFLRLLRPEYFILPFPVYEI